MGLRPRQIFLHLSVPRALDPRDAIANKRVELAGLECRHCRFRGTAVAGRFTATIGDVPATTLWMLDADVDLGCLGIETTSVTLQEVVKTRVRWEISVSNMRVSHGEGPHSPLRSYPRESMMDTRSWAVPEPLLPHFDEISKP